MTGFYRLALMLSVVVAPALVSCLDHAPPYGGVVPLASLNDTIVLKIKAITRLIEEAKARPPQKKTRDVGKLPQKQTRDGGLFGEDDEGGGGLLGLILKLQSLMALLQLLSPATTPASGSGAATTVAGAAAAAPPAAPAAPTLAQLLSLMPLLGGGFGGYSGDDANQAAIGYESRTCGICDPHTDIQTLIALPDYILAIGKDNAYRIALDGTPLDVTGESKFIEYGRLNGTATATLRINENYYIFYGSEVSLLDSKTKEPLPPLAVRDLFFGVKEAVRGAFRFNEHTLTLFLDRHFVFYQPLANPPVDPRFSPQPVTVIPNGPDKIDGALEINGTNYLYRQGWLYQIGKDEMVVVSKRPLRQLGFNSGWMKCAGQKTCS